MNHKTKSPNINLRTIGFFSKNLGWHENRSSDNLFVNLFLYRKTKVSQFIQDVGSFFFQKYVVRLDISMYNVIFRNELNTASKLINNLDCVWFREGTALGNNLIQIAIGTKLEYHGDVIFSKEAIVYFSGEHSIGIITVSKFEQNIDLPIYVRIENYW